MCDAEKPTSAPIAVTNKQTNKQTNCVAFSPQANYNDWAIATCWQNLVPTFADREVSRGQRGESSIVVNLSFNLSSSHSQGLSGPGSRPTATQKIW
jgi:hypothetical protein